MTNIVIYLKHPLDLFSFHQSKVANTPLQPFQQSHSQLLVLLLQVPINEKWLELIEHN